MDWCFVGRMLLKACVTLVCTAYLLFSREGKLYWVIQVLLVRILETKKSNLDFNVYHPKIYYS